MKDKLFKYLEIYNEDGECFGGFQSSDLGMTCSERGGSRSTISLFRTNSDRTEEQLVSFHPHQLHASDRKAGDEITSSLPSFFDKMLDLF